VLPLARALARRGHSAAVFIPPYDSIEDSGQRWRDIGVEVINVALPTGGQSAPWHWQLGWRLYSAAARWRPDVVHAFKPKGPSGLAATLFWTRRQGSRPRLVVDADDWEGPGGWNDNPAAGYSEGQKRFFAWQEKYGLSHADAWTVTSACLAERAAGFGAPAARVHILHNGVEPASASPTETARVGGQPRVLLYTRFAGVRPADVSGIWSVVRETYDDAILTIIGKGALGEERELGDVPGVEVKGWLEPAEIQRCMRQAAVAVAPWANTAANRARHSAKILELMQSGLAIVAYAVGELTVTPGATGVLVSPGDGGGFAAAVVALLGEPARAASLGAAAEELVRARFTWDALATIAERAYGAM
jgi:glycosyltransferase involved in cell wall biosynthesis